MNELRQALQWLHADLPPDELAQRMSGYCGRLQSQPPGLRRGLLPRMLTAAANGSQAAWAEAHPTISSKDKGAANSFVAGCYFCPLAGKVANLGSARAAQGWEAQAAGLLQAQIAELQAAGWAQIQAVVPAEDGQTQELLRRAGLRLLTHVQHHYLPVADSASGRGGRREAAALLVEASIERKMGGSQLRWQPANKLSARRLARLVERTFEQTLDCPALNGRRTAAQVLEGFLDGRALRQLGRWWELLEWDDEPVGCLLLQAHASDLVEIVYLGLVPAARGRRLGQQLVHRAIGHCQTRGARWLIAAVDEQNWPAVGMYRATGFFEHQRFSVWLED